MPGQPPPLLSKRSACCEKTRKRAVEFTGVFFVGVKTTGVFCISVCRARKPRRENVEFYNDVKSALDAGFRPCKVCRPTENARTAPAFVEQALRLLREDP
ncbi:Ada metal-binding domain-containing protein, partial [Klebsiella variicola]|uniref:Ada metal-binding domain-containing protein n=1 Tax=Klebsiella variicola TaxID=244366 RepID=UPI000BD535F8